MPPFGGCCCCCYRRCSGNQERAGASSLATFAAGIVDKAFKSAEAAYNNRKVDLESALLNQKAQAGTVESDYQQAKQLAEASAGNTKATDNRIIRTDSEEQLIVVIRFLKAWKGVID